MAQFEFKDDTAGATPTQQGEKPASVLKADPNDPGIKAAAATQRAADRLAKASSAVSGVVSTAQGVLSAVPGARYLTNKVGQALGMDEAGMVKTEGNAIAQHPMLNAAGAGTGAALVGAATAGATGLTAAGGAAGAAAVAASEAGIMMPIYKLGEMAADTASPLHIEQVAHVLDLNDILAASGIAALAHAPGLLSAGAGALAETQAGRGLKKAAKELDRPARGLGREALDKGLLSKVGNADKMRLAAGAQMEGAVTGVPVDTAAQDSFVATLNEVVDNAIDSPATAPALRKIGKFAESIANDGEIDAKRVHEAVTALKEYGNKATGNQAERLYMDAAHRLEDKLTDHISTFDPQKGIDFKNAKQDYRLYARIQKQADALAEKQVSAFDVGKAALLSAGAEKVASLAGNGYLSTAAALAAGGASISNRSSVVLLDKMSKISPGNLFNGRMQATIDGLLAPNLSAQVVGSADDMARYDDMAKALKNHVANPDASAKNLREKLDFLPPVTADAVTANTIEKLNAMCATMPGNQGPATAFGIQTHPSDREKREFLRKCDARFDPYGAVMSGRKDLIQEAERCNPETVHEIKKAIIDRITANPDSIDYMTKRKVCGILGLPGVPGQDPGIGAHLQSIIQTRRQAQDSQGQMKSARQANANLKNNSATLTRAQKILNNGD